MRITMGSNVEVWMTDAAPQIGAWRAGEVKWGNGHSYVMRWFDDDGGPEVSGRISRKFVRPFPPDVPLPEELAAGDVVEVLDGGLWKWAEVVGAGGKCSRFDVKIVGSSKVLTADRSELRVRQVLKEDDVWVVLHKDNEISVVSAVPSRPIAGKHVKKKAMVVDGSSKFAAQTFKLGNTKRSHCMVVDAGIARDVKRFQGGNGNTKKLCTKEEPAARYDGNLEVIDVQPSHYLQKKKRQEIMSNGEEYCDVVGTETDSSSTSSTSSSDDDATSKSDPSSSGGGGSSSSGSNSDGGDQEAAIQPLPSCEKEQRDDSDGDRTESRASARMAPHNPAHERAVATVVKQDEQEDELEQEQHDDRVHGLELEAYASLMKAFHASGSLTWKKEELLCHLRLLLNISSDEHLQVIWHLNGRRKPAGGAHNGHC